VQKKMSDRTPHTIYTGENYKNVPFEELEKIYVPDGQGSDVKLPIVFKVVKPSDADGKERDQTNDAANHMRYAATLGLPELVQKTLPRQGKAVIVGGAPSVKNYLEKIREFSKNPFNGIFALNWSHTWLIKNRIIPRATVFFEIDSEPETSLKAAHPDVMYFICSHCHPNTFDQLNGFKRVLWHSIPNSDVEQKVHDEIFSNSAIVGGGIGTFTRTLAVAMYIGYRDFELFGCDSSYPDNDKTHVDGYETLMDDKTDGLYVYARHDVTGEVRRFRTIGPLALQHEEFKEFCKVNHQYFTLRVHGDSLLRYTHERMYSDQYESK
jgi:uncharacterized Rossmann fold enzyme